MVDMFAVVYCIVDRIQYESCHADIARSSIAILKSRMMTSSKISFDLEWVL